MVGPLSYIDIVLIAVSLISGLLAMYRGLTREVLSILSWAVAAVAGLFAFSMKSVAGDISQQISAPLLVAQLGLALLAFLVSLIVVHLITSRISDAMLDSRVGMIDRMLGFGFGVVRGFVLVVLPFMLYETLYPNPDQQPKFVSQTVSLPYIRSTGVALAQVGQSVGAMVERMLPRSLSEPRDDGRRSDISPSHQSTGPATKSRPDGRLILPQLHISVTRA